MEPVTTLATAVISILSPYLAKGAEEFMKAAGKDAYDKAKKILTTLKASWADDEEARDQLTQFEEQPERYQPVLEDILQEKLAQDKELVGELTQLLNEMDPSVEIIQKIKEAEEAVGLEAKEMTGGQARVEQEIEQGKRITGAKFDRLG